MNNIFIVINYSVIIPHGNSLDTLSRAIDSIPNRMDIEVIVVDNSPVPITKEDVKAERHYLLFYSARERHAGGARNEGINHASGKYLLFLDADDFYNEGAFDIFDRWLDNNLDIVFFDVTSKYSDTLEICRRSEYTNSLFRAFENGGDVNAFRFKYYTPWCKLFLRQFIVDHAISFDEVEACNDLMFSMRTGEMALSVAADVSKPYCVTIRKGSLCFHTTKERSRIRYKVMISQCVYMKEIGHPEYAIRMISCIVNALKNYGWDEFSWYVCLAKENEVRMLSWKRAKRIVKEWFS